MTLFTVGRLLLLTGLVLVVLGAGHLFLNALGAHRVPGTLVWRRGGLILVVPIGVMVVGSVLLMVLLDLPWCR